MTRQGMTGLFASLTPEQRKAALAYDGPQDHGDPAFAVGARGARLPKHRLLDTAKWEPAPWQIARLLRMARRAKTKHMRNAARQARRTTRRAG